MARWAEEHKWLEKVGESALASVLWAAAALWIASDQWAHDVPWLDFRTAFFYVLVGGTVFETLRVFTATADKDLERPARSAAQVFAYALMMLLFLFAAIMLEFCFRKGAGDEFTTLAGRVAIHFVFGGAYLAFAQELISLRRA
ncbi:MAG: hypothetical protein V3W41_08520 [Planctomycetota bacterium]